MDKTILLDIADQTARNFGRADADFAQKISRRLRRKFAQSISRETVLEQAAHFRAIYQYASARLTECLRPSGDGYAHLNNVDSDKFIALLQAEFPAEQLEILNTICGWVIYYNYLH